MQKRIVNKGTSIPNLEQKHLMKYKLKNSTRLLLVVAAIALVVVLFSPIWRIELTAPQYPEGLALTIHAKGLQGNVDIINGLNHYIGMKTLHNADFVEFTVLPYFILFFVISLLLVAIFNKRPWLYTIFFLFLAFGVIAMVDFWRWEYQYGHELDPAAAIIVPGMAYQPPLIGFKQLLNFGAYSVPDIGAWIFIVVGLTLLICSIMEAKKSKENIRQFKFAHAGIALFVLVTGAACNPGPEPLRSGADQCSSCKMLISDLRFGGEIVTRKGRIYKFDDSHCIAAFLKSSVVQTAGVKTIYMSDFCDGHQLLDVNKAHFLKSNELRSPMGGNAVAFSNADSLDVVLQQFKGKTVTWAQMIK